jgi:hypothetical protein
VHGVQAQIVRMARVQVGRQADAAPITHALQRVAHAVRNPCVRAWLERHRNL